ncbi:uncharacterized protein B0H64DRAFT_391880 [Chaetomium fimeti]|uniref:Uncharacterized protein n=1 Tax=Chaetomium fimeti TaxID=1854472 RepID=A0AAE0HIQ1_9PEZI|nr:hypothetical protein B0H64DRAFT_391880 [Chaetomium fimeti]
MRGRKVVAVVVGVPLLAGCCLRLYAHHVTKLVDATAAHVDIHVHTSSVHHTAYRGGWSRRGNLLTKAGLWEGWKTRDTVSLLDSHCVSS